MAIQNDFTIYPKTKVIRHTSGTTTYTAVQFYSWLMDTFDEPGYLTYEVPIKFNTPTSFTMINSWFLDNGTGSNLLKYIYGGGIDTSGYFSAADPVYMLDLDEDGVAGYAAFVSGDLDKDIEDDATAVGPLLAYINSYPSGNTNRIWVRDTRGTPASIADNSVITVASGTGKAKVNGDFFTGYTDRDEIYLNLFTIASLPTTPDPQVYVYQAHPSTQSSSRIRIAEWSHLSNWDRDPTTQPTDNYVDIVFPIKLGGVLIDSGQFKTFVRQTGDSFTFVESTITSSGRTPVAIETSTDINITGRTLAGEYYLLYDGGTSPSISAGDLIQDVATGGSTPATWYAEVVSHTAFDTATGVLEIRALKGAPADTNNIFVGASDTTANVNGTVGDTYLSWTSGTAPTTIGQIMTGGTSAAKRLLRAVDATAKKAVLQDDPTGVTGANRNPYYKDFSSGETVTGGTDGSVVLDADSTTLISGYNDITVANINGTITTGAFSGGTGTYTLGERVTWNAGSSSAIVVEYVLDTSLTLANVDPADEPVNLDVIVGDISGTSATASAGLTDGNTENYNFTLQTAHAYSVFVEGGSIYNDSSAGRSLSDIYAYLQYYVRDGQDISTRAIYTSDGATITLVAAEEYIKADAAYSATKAAPFGTLAGSVFFGAQGVWLQGMSSSDNNNVRLTGDDGILYTPDPSIDLTITNTRVGDRVAVYPKHATLTLPNKTQYTSHDINNVQSGSIFDAADGTTFPNDTPLSGTFIAVDTSASEEHRYRYSSWDNTGGTGGNDGHLILPTERTGTAGALSTGQTLDAPGATFQTWGIQIGDIIRRTNGSGGWAYVTAITDEDTLTTTLLSAGSGWATTETFEMLSLVVTYVAPGGAANDTFFIPYMDFREDTGTDGSPGSQTVTVNYIANRSVIIEARNVENSTQIIPFTTTNTISSTGMSQSIIRNEDTVYA